MNVGEASTRKKDLWGVQQCKRLYFSSKVLVHGDLNAALSIESSFASFASIVNEEARPLHLTKTCFSLKKFSAGSQGVKLPGSESNAQLLWEQLRRKRKGAFVSRWTLSLQEF